MGGSPLLFLPKAQERPEYPSDSKSPPSETSERRRRKQPSPSDRRTDSSLANSSSIAIILLRQESRRRFSTEQRLPTQELRNLQPVSSLHGTQASGKSPSLPNLPYSSRRTRPERGGQSAENSGLIRCGQEPLEMSRKDYAFLFAFLAVVVILGLRSARATTIS